MNRNNIHFVAKYGTSDQVDKLIRSDIPHWNDVQGPQLRSVFNACLDAAQNPATTERQKSKILRFDQMAKYQRAQIAHHMVQANPDLASHHIEEISKLTGEHKDLDTALYWHKNLTSKAVGHMIEASKSFGDDSSHLETKKQQLEKAGK